MRSQRGQATVELVALLPLLVVAGVAATAVLARQGARERAGEAAHAGAMALLQDGDPRAAARDALPAAERAAATVRWTGRRVTVTLPAPPPLRALPGLGARATADAGPDPAP